MNRYLISIVLLFVLFGFNSYGEIEFTDEELNWMKEHPVIYHAPDPDYAPFEYQQSNKIEGIVIEYLDLVREQLPIEIISIDSPTWIHSLELMKNEEANLITGAITKERLEYLEFTVPYLEVPTGILTRQNNREELNLNDLDDKKVAVVKGWITAGYLGKHYPKIITIPYDSVNAALQAVSFGEVDAMVINMATATFEIEKSQISNLRVAGYTEFTYNLSFATNKSNPEFVSILNKCLAEVSEAQKESIVNKWISIKNKPFYLTKGFLRVVVLVSGILIGIFIWNISLKREVRLRTSELDLKIVELNNSKAALEKNHAYLETMYTNLVNTQRKLVESEKMAVLGSLTAGISHEINTPLGICLTTITHVNKSTDESIKCLESKKLTQNDLLEYFETVKESSGILSRNLENAQNLVTNFKDMSIAHITHEKTHFDVCQNLNNVIRSLTYELKKKNIHFKLQCDDTLLIESYPSMFSQIFTNLIMNSLVHGFENTDRGVLSINIDITDKQLCIEYYDDGVGISAENAENIFKPLFTTKKNAGGSGLGLHIIYSMVRENLKGNVELVNDTEKGVHFSICIPMDHTKKETYS